MRITSRDLQKADDIEILEEKEQWNTYKLGDGSTLKIKPILQKVKRLKRWHPDGKPVYVVECTEVTRLSDVPKELKGKPKPSAFEAI